MATEKQFEANRQNAQKSTGPKTPEGRAAVRLNGVKHGLTAETIVLKGESQADFTNVLAQPSQFGRFEAGMPFVFSKGTSKVSTTFGGEERTLTRQQW